MRQDDRNKRCHFRSAERVFHMNGSWYFVTREGEEGPYPSETQTQVEIARFVSEKTELAHFQQEREAECARAQELDLVNSDERPRIRPSEPLLLKRQVYI